jgi:hypothetical protein
MFRKSAKFVVRNKMYHWDCLFGPKRPLLIFRGTLSGKTKQIEEKRKIEMLNFGRKKKDRNARLVNTNEPCKIKLMFLQSLIHTFMHKA